MRKLREAAVVAAMVGSVSMLGAGVASAGGWEEPKQEIPTVNCDQDASTTESSTQIGGTLTYPVTGEGGDADASATQQICGIDNEDNENTAGDATGGTGTEILD